MKFFNRGVFFLGIMLILATANSFAADTAIKVENIAIGTSVVDKKPEGVSSEFLSNVKKLFCFTKITGSKKPTTIMHVWFYGDKVMAEVPLTISSPQFRTYSSKNILPEWKGEWKVEVLSEGGETLSSTSFVIQN